MSESASRRSKSIFEGCNLKVFDRPNSFLISKLARNSEIGPKMARKFRIWGRGVGGFINPRCELYIYIYIHTRQNMAAPRPYISRYPKFSDNFRADFRNFRAIFGPILLFRASFDIKNEFGRSKTFRLHPSNIDLVLRETDLDIFLIFI